MREQVRRARACKYNMTSDVHICELARPQTYLRMPAAAAAAAAGFGRVDMEALSELCDKMLSNPCPGQT